jgi:tape measure domain-containing protein
MSNIAEFILKLVDQMSPALRAAAATSGTSTSAIAKGLSFATGASRTMASSLQDLKTKLEQVNQTRLTTRFASQFREASREARQLESQIERMENRGKRGGGGGGGGLVGSFVKGNLIAGAITEGLGMAKDMAIDVYRTTLRNSSLETAINSTTGGQGREAIARTSAIAEKYGLNYEASLEGVKTLTGGLKGMNMTLAEQMRIFEGVSTGMAAMKLDAEASKGAMLALGQMASKGTVSAEELRGQLGERIPGAFSIAAKAMGVTEAKLGDMMKAGDVAAKDFLPRFAEEMRKTFGADALAAANGPAAAQERFNNALYKSKVVIGETLMPMITPIMETFTQLATQVVPYIQEGIRWIGDQVRELLNPTGKWAAYVDIVKNHFRHVWETAKSLFKNVWDIVGGLIEWIRKSELMQDIAWGIGKAFEAVMWIVRKVGDILKWIWDTIIKPILDGVEWIYKNLKGLFSGIATNGEIIVRHVDDKTKPAQQAYTAVIGGSLMKMSLGSKLAGKTAAAASNGRGGGMLTATSSNDKLDKIGKEKSEAVNGGGQRPIIINIAKQVGIETVNTGTVKESITDMRQAIMEEMRRTIYAIGSTEAA